jgi:hypothetical protein
MKFIFYKILVVYFLDYSKVSETKKESELFFLTL